MDQEVIEVDATYEFNLSEQTRDDYQYCKKIIEWLKSNMENITDDKNHKLFSKVNYGYNTETIKGFGKKPVCDVYINNIQYRSDIAKNIPDTITTFIICYLKGNANNTYLKATELTDYLIQEFEENDDFRELTNVVRNTTVQDIEIQNIPTGKTYGVICAFELEHELY